MIEFEWLEIFYCLPLPLLGLLLPKAKNQNQAIRVPFYSIVNNISNEMTAKFAIRIWHYFYYFCLLLIWLLLLLSMSRPIWNGEPITLQTSGRDLLLAVDISGSMKESDMQLKGKRITRIDATKIVIDNFIQRRSGDRIGLILFGEQAYMQTPLTFDLKTVKTQLNEARIGFAGRSTAIGDAIGLAVKRLLERNITNDSDKVIILLTDGSNTAGTDPLLSAQIAAEEGVTIYTIGIGAEVITRRSFFGVRKMQNTEIDEQTLITIAKTTNGKYYRARNVNELNQIYDVIEDLEKIPEDTTYRPKIQLFFYPLLAATILSFILAFAAILKRRYG